MAFSLIQGTYRILGFRPDGDSIRFAPRHPDLLNRLPRARRMLRPGHAIQLRLESIDALETHFMSGSPLLERQPLRPADAARDHLLELLGFKHVQWSAGAVVSVDADDRPGYILTHKCDNDGRPIAYVFAGAAPDADGSRVFLQAPMLAASVNHRLLARGYVYPMYYQGAFHDLRASLDAAVRAAQAHPHPTSVWATDATRSGAAVPPFATLVDDVAIWPKLFRRISRYFYDNPRATSLAGLLPYMEGKPDPCFDLDTGSFTALHNYVEVADGKVRMTKDVMRLIFQD
jgi:hypothetical protein